jgi:hypothetical protein
MRRENGLSSLEIFSFCEACQRPSSTLQNEERTDRLALDGQAKMTVTSGEGKVFIFPPLGAADLAASQGCARLQRKQKSQLSFLLPSLHCSLKAK